MHCFRADDYIDGAGAVASADREESDAAVVSGNIDTLYRYINFK